MPEILLARHSQALVNVGDLAFGNQDSPLTERGIMQSGEQRLEFIEKYDITPEKYPLPVLASKYRRPQQSAEVAGFRIIHTSAEINEADVYDEVRRGTDVIEKHRTEHWAPEEDLERAKRFIEKVSSGELSYEIFYTHGMFIGAVLLECEVAGVDMTNNQFDDNPVGGRGYIPLQASITKLVLPG